MYQQIKKVVSLLIVVLILITSFDIPVYAKKSGIDRPVLSVKTVNDGSGVKITFSGIDDADGYEIVISGVPQNEKYLDFFKKKLKQRNSDDISVELVKEFSEEIPKFNKSKTTITYKDLQPGSYKVKVRTFNEMGGTKVYNNDWSDEKSFKLKESNKRNCKLDYDFNKVKKGDIIKFGAYEQDLDYTNGKEAIEWIVLEKKNNTLLLMSKYILDIVPYNNDRYSSIQTNWENCSLREWLNSVFYKSAFDKNEGKMIVTASIDNSKVTFLNDGGLDPEYPNAYQKIIAQKFIKQNKNTKDKVFIPSVFDMVNKEYGFSEEFGDYHICRRCTYAWEKDLYDENIAYIDNHWEYEHFKNDGIATTKYMVTRDWWLRSQTETDFCSVDEYGSIIRREWDGYGTLYDLHDSRYYGPGVRPAIYISIK